jgi:hypothetical protein
MSNKAIKLPTFPYQNKQKMDSPIFRGWRMVQFSLKKKVFK